MIHIDEYMKSLPHSINLLVTGVNNFDDYELFYKEVSCMCQELESMGFDITIISGGGPGTDSFAKEFSQRAKLKFNQFESEMVDMAHLAIFFWDGKDTGVSDIIRKSHTRGIFSKVVVL